MSKKDVGIEAVKEVISSSTDSEVRIGEEWFSTRILHFDQNSGSVIVDQIVPKYGDKFLTAKETYIFKHSDCQAGIINLIELSMNYIKPTTFKGASAHIFSTPKAIQRKSSFYDIEPKSADDIYINFLLGSQKLNVKVVRLNLRNLYFKLSVQYMKFPKEGLPIREVVFTMRESRINFIGRLFREQKYDYRMEIEEIGAEGQMKLSQFIETRYCEIKGFVNPEIDDKSEFRRPGILRKPSLETKKKIFIVDDEVLVTNMLSKILSRHGFQCFTFNDGKEVVDRAFRQKPDLIMLDLNMPYIDGLTVLRRLKRNKDTAQIPVVMLTSSQELDDVMDAKSFGVSKYIVKSADMDLEELADQVDSIIKASG
ncbi:MAG: response regulator [candidate division Zixibacteria bacterium]|nr:response regulator [Candidatus Tariuqbacter arcticus]